MRLESPEDHPYPYPVYPEDDGTDKPSKLKKGAKSAKRRKSFCARMSGMKKAHASAKTKRDPDSPINKALRRWNCE